MSKLELKAEGNRQYAAGNWEAAINAFTQALVIDPDFGVCLANRAACWIQLGSWARGLADCDTALSKVLTLPVKVKVYWRLAKCQQALGTPWGATVLQGLAIDPSNVELLNMLTDVPVQRLDSLPAKYRAAVASQAPAAWTPPARPASYATVQSLMRQRRPEADQFAFETTAAELVAAHRGIGIDPEEIDYFHRLIAARGGAHGRDLLAALKQCDRYAAAEFLADETLAAAAAAAAAAVSP